MLEKGLLALFLFLCPPDFLFHFLSKGHFFLSFFVRGALCPTCPTAGYATDNRMVISHITIMWVIMFIIIIVIIVTMVMQILIILLPLQ